MYVLILLFKFTLDFSSISSFEKAIYETENVSINNTKWM